MANTPNDEPGNEARHTGDRLGFPHPIADETSLDAARSTLGEGVPVTLNGSGEVVEATGTGDTIVGILYTLPVYGDSSRAGPYVDGSKDATVGYRGSYTADLSNFETDVGDVTTGQYLDDGGDVFVKHNIEGSVYEVMVR
jgi:hypothetical protein